LSQSVQINDKKFKIIRKIGEGGFGYVYCAREINRRGKSSGNYFALKKMLCQSEEQRDEAQHEVDTLLALQGAPHVLQLLDSSSNPTTQGYHEVLLLMPLFHEDAQQMIDQGPGYPHCSVQLEDAVRMFLACCKGIQYMHQKGLKHNDIKPANVLISEDKQEVVITDFGSTEPLEIKITNRQQALLAQENAAKHTTAPYRAPELFDCPSECILGASSDVWSLGCLFYAFLYSRSPFENPTEGVLTLKIMAGTVDFPEESESTFGQDARLKALHNSISEMLTVDVVSRIHLDQVITQIENLSNASSDMFNGKENDMQPLKEQYVSPSSIPVEQQNFDVVAGEELQLNDFADFDNFPPQPEEGQAQTDPSPRGVNSNSSSVSDLNYVEVPRKTEFYPPPVAADERFLQLEMPLAEGPVLQYRARGLLKRFVWKEVWLSLDQTRLQLRKTQNSSSKEHFKIEFTQLKELSASENNESSYGFTITSCCQVRGTPQKDVFPLRALSEQSRADWIEYINLAASISITTTTEENS